jgi:hypothetical protein
MLVLIIGCSLLLCVILFLAHIVREDETDVENSGMLTPVNGVHHITPEEKEQEPEVEGSEETIAPPAKDEGHVQDAKNRTPKRRTKKNSK